MLAIGQLRHNQRLLQAVPHMRQILSQLIDVMNSGLIHKFLNEKPNRIIHWTEVWWVCWAHVWIKSGVVHHNSSVASQRNGQAHYPEHYAENKMMKCDALFSDDISEMDMFSCICKKSCLQLCKNYKNQTSFSRIMITKCTATFLWLTVYVEN